MIEIMKIIFSKRCCSSKVRVSGCLPESCGFESHQHRKLGYSLTVRAFALYAIGYRFKSYCPNKEYEKI